MPELALLSICIPTYNYGPFIGEALDSILPQLSPEVEVIVLDGGSTDGTPEEVAFRQRNCAQLAYHQQGFRGGIDRDIEKVVSFAKGQYCWLFSADDIMLPGAIHKVLRAIRSNHDVYICEHIICDIDMKPIHAHPPFNDVHHPRVFDFAHDVQREEYFRLARSSEAFFSFLGGPIFKKEIWDGVSAPESFRSTCWIVAGHLLSTMRKGITLNYLHATLIHKRDGNDAFSGGSLVKHCAIHTENFQHVANVVFGVHSTEAFHIRRVLQREVTFQMLLLAKLKASQFPEKEDIKTLRHLVALHYMDSIPANWVRRALFHAAPPSLLNVAWHVKQWLRRKCSVRDVWEGV